MNWVVIGVTLVVGVTLPFVFFLGKDRYDKWNYRRRYKKKLPIGVRDAQLEYQPTDEDVRPWVFTAVVPEKLLATDSPVIEIEGRGRNIEEAIEDAAFAYYFTLEMEKKTSK